MPTVDFRSRKGISALASSAGAGITMLIVQGLAVYWPSSDFAKFFSGQVIAIATGFFTFVSYVLISAALEYGTDFKYRRNEKTLREMLRDSPNNLTVQKALTDIQSSRARDLSKYK